MAEAMHQRERPSVNIDIPSGSRTIHSYNLPSLTYFGFGDGTSRQRLRASRDVFSHTC